MHISTPSLLLLSASISTLLSLSAAAPPPPPPPPAVEPRRVASQLRAAGFKDLILTDIYTNTFDGGETTTQNRRITFHLIDPNSSTKTCCTLPWTASASNNNNTSNLPPTAPSAATGYAACDATGLKESFGWYFTGYVGLGEFAVRIRHAFDDPVNYPPPYSVVTVFSDVNITLSCIERGGQRGCTMPPGTTEVRAPVNAAVN